MSSKEREVLVQIDHLKKFFPLRKGGKNAAVRAVDDVSINIYKGETWKDRINYSYQKSK